LLKLIEREQNFQDLFPLATVNVVERASSAVSIRHSAVFVCVYVERR